MVRSWPLFWSSVDVAWISVDEGASEFRHGRDERHRLVRTLRAQTGLDWEDPDGIETLFLPCQGQE
jgi:hypothetical protein